MQAEEIKNIKSKIFVYNIDPFNSIGIYIGESKEEALKSITSEIWDDVNPEFYEKARLVNIIDAIGIWTWEEYQEQQGFKVSERLLEITSQEEIEMVTTREKIVTMILSLSDEQMEQLRGLINENVELQEKAKYIDDLMKRLNM